MASITAVAACKTDTFPCEQIHIYHGVYCSIVARTRLTQPTEVYGESVPTFAQENLPFRTFQQVYALAPWAAYSLEEENATNTSVSSNTLAMYLHFDITEIRVHLDIYVGHHLLYKGVISLLCPLPPSISNSIPLSSKPLGTLKYDHSIHRIKYRC